MKTLRKTISKFYAEYYHILGHGKGTKLTKSEMLDHNTLMSVYEDVWVALDYEMLDYDTHPSEYKWVSDLYGDLGDYIHDLEPTTYKWYSMTMGNIVPNFGDVLSQVWDSLIHYRVLDLRWQYKRGGF